MNHCEKTLGNVCKCKWEKEDDPFSAKFPKLWQNVAHMRDFTCGISENINNSLTFSFVFKEY